MNGDQYDFKSDEQNIEKHVFKILETLEFDCEFCEFATNTEGDLSKHQHEKHSITCDQCSEEFIGIERLARHMCKK